MKIKPPKQAKRSNLPLRAALQLLVMVAAVLIALMLNDMRRNRTTNNLAGQALLAMRYEIRQNEQPLKDCTPTDSTLWETNNPPANAAAAYIVLQNVVYVSNNQWIFKTPYWQTDAYEVGVGSIQNMPEDLKIRINRCYALQKRLAEQHQNIRYHLLMASPENARLIWPLVAIHWNELLQTKKQLLQLQKTTVKNIDELQIES